MDNINEWLFGTDPVGKAIDKSRPSGETEVEKNASLADSLKRRGFEVKSSRRGADIVGEDFVVECKLHLTSKPVLDRLKGQIDDYVNVEKKPKVYVLIHGDAKRSLLADLERYCAQFGFLTSVVITVKGRVVEDSLSNKTLAGSDVFDVSDVQKQIRDILS